APAVVRYPRGVGCGANIETKMQALTIGKAHVCRHGQKIAILCFGTLLHHAKEAANTLDATLVDMRFVKPLDETLLCELAQTHDLLVTVEENVIAGGAGSAVSEYLMAQCLIKPVLHLGLPDEFIAQGTQQEQYAQAQLDSIGILTQIKNFWQKLQRTL
ncbi:MAG: transketolase C-terminal domain-containing protein, partial [Enterovibrio sp.]